MHNLFLLFFINILIAEKLLNAVSGDINKVLLIKTLYSNESLFDYAPTNSLFKHFKPSKHFSSLFR